MKREPSKQHDNEYWSRLDEIIRATGFNVNSFARYLGLRNSENLYQIRRGNNGISRDLAQRIHRKFPDFPISWIMFGIDEPSYMRDDEGQIVRIPVYCGYATMVLPPQELADDYLTLSVSAARSAEFAIPYSDDLLNPYLQGSILLLRQRREQEPIVYGNIYLVDIEGMRLLRIVKRNGSDPGLLRLTTLLPTLFDDLIVPAEQIRGMWLAVAAVCNLAR